MPLISEQEFLEYNDLLDSPEISPEDRNFLENQMLKYDEQQKDLGLSLTPNLENLERQTEKAKKQEIRDLYSGIESVGNYIPNKDLYPDDESRAQFANSFFLSKTYGDNYNQDSYEEYKADYNNKFNNKLHPKTELEFYNFIKGQVDNDAKRESIVTESFNQGFRSAMLNEPLNVAVSRLQKTKGPEFDVGVFTKAYNERNSVTEPFQKDMEQFNVSISKYMNGQATDEDKNSLSEFSKKLVNMNGKERQYVLSSLMTQGAAQGQKDAQGKNVVQEAGESFARIYSEALFGGSSRLVEKVIPRVPTTGEVITSVKEIKTLEDAERYVKEYVTTELSVEGQMERPSLGEPGIARASLVPNGIERTLSPEEEELIEKAKRKSQKAITIEREIREIAKGRDPIREGAMSTMASTIGSSAALLPWAFAPGGQSMAYKLYSDMDYNEIRRELPDVPIATAESMSQVSGAVKAGLDKLTAGFVKTSMPTLTRLISGEATIGTSLLKNFGVNALAGMGFEFGIEGAQDATLPVVQALFSAISEDVPAVDFEKEYGEWMNSRADVAIGLVPLVMLGAGGIAVAEKVNVNKILDDDLNMQRLGISDTDRQTILQLRIDGNSADAARAFIESYARRDVNAANALAQAEKASESTVTQDTSTLIEDANRLNILPEIYTDNGKFVVDAKTGNPVEFTEFTDAQEYALTFAGDQINTANKSVTDIINGTRTINQSNLGVFDANVDARTDIVSELNGLTKPEIKALNDTFGTQVENNAVVETFARGIFGNTLNPNKIVEIVAKNILANAPDAVTTFVNDSAQAQNVTPLEFVSNAIKSVPNTTNASFNHLINKGTADIGRAFAIAKTLSGKEQAVMAEGREIEESEIVSEIESILPITNTKALQGTIDKRKIELEQPRIIEKEILEGIKVGNLKQEEIRQKEVARRSTLNKFLGRIRASINKGQTGPNNMADAFAALDETVTVEELNALTVEEKTAKLDAALTKIEKSLAESYVQEIEQFVSELKQLKADGKIKDDYDTTVDAIIDAISSSNPDAEALSIYKKLYPDNGVPDLTDGDFYTNLVRYNAFKFLGGIANKSSNQLQQTKNFIEKLFNKVKTGTTTVRFFEELKTDLVASKNELYQNPTLDKRSKKITNSIRNSNWFKDTGRVISSFYDNHLTFASLLELVFPNSNNSMTIAEIERINTLGKKVSDGSITSTEITELNLLKSKATTGKGITPTMQKISDNITNAMLDVQNENTTVQDTLSILVNKVFGKQSGFLKSSRFGAKKVLFDMLNTYPIDVTINGKTQKLSTGYAAYILNIADQKIHDQSLADKGFTADVIKGIRDTMKKDYSEVDAFRKELIKQIRSEVSATNSKYTDVFGFGIPIPEANFFPVQFKSRDIAVINPYDIQYQSGKMRMDFDPMTDLDTRELDIDLREQNNNLLTMFNSYMYQSIYKRNLMAPLIAAKNVLTDTQIADTIESSYGKAFLQQIHKQLGAFETNGISSTFFDYITTGRIRRMLTNIARGAMGYRSSTFFVNMMSSGNTLMDSSIPLRTALKSYVRVLSAFTGIKGTTNMNALQALKSKEIQDRITNGANSLIAMSKAQTLVDKPGWMTEVADKSLTPMTWADAFAGSLAAAAAYDAHYRMAQKAGITDVEVLEEMASEGMARTINKTFQPSILSGKSSYEMQSNPFLKLMTMFMSEARKTLGLELTAIKKNGILSKEAARMIFVNHIMIGGITFLLRAWIKDLFSDEEEDDKIYDWSRMAVDMMLGPLSASFIAGTIFEEAGYRIHNILIDAWDIEDEDKIQIFGDQNPIVQAGQQGLGVFKLWEGWTGDEEYTNEQMMKDINNSLKGISILTGSSSLGGAATITNALKQLADLSAAQTE